MTYWKQFDPDQTTPAIDALLDGDSEILACAFVNWLAQGQQREALYHLVVDRLQDADIRALARTWLEAEDE